MTPENTGDDHLVLLPVDPHRAYAFWEIGAATIRSLRAEAGEDAVSLVLRVQLSSTIRWDDTHGKSSFDLVVDSSSGNFYVNLATPGLSLWAEIGVRREGGAFHFVAESSRVDLPRDGESEIYEDRRSEVRGEADPQWRERAAGVPPAPANAESGRQSPYLEAFSGDEEVLQHSVLPAAFSHLALRHGYVEPLTVAAAEAAHSSWDDEDLAAPEADDRRRPSGETEAGDPQASAPSPKKVCSGDFSSWSLSSWSVRRQERAREEEHRRVEFDAAIVLEGRVDPGAEIVVADSVVKAREDGSFELRLSLPVAAALKDVRDLSLTEGS